MKRLRNAVPAGHCHSRVFGGRMIGGWPCQKPAGHGPDGNYCAGHAREFDKSKPRLELWERKLIFFDDDEPPHRVVRIVPHAFRYARDATTGRHHRSPRLHWRRSHLRHLADGKVIVIARMLVGRAELGEVSHEYLIKSETHFHHSPETTT